MNSLLARLSVALLLILLLVGGGFFAIERWSSTHYHEEVTQRLNAAIAMYVTGQTTLIHNGRVDQDSLKRLAEQAMVINPSVEVYLLDRSGRILAHALPPETVVDARVDLTPIKALIEGRTVPPTYAMDPRNPAREKVFSAAPVVDDDSLEGYLYVVLGGRKYDELAGKVGDSYAVQSSIFATMSLVTGGFLAGLAVFALLTRRLSRLTRSVENFSRSALDGIEVPELPGAFAAENGDGDGDEIDKLNAAFAAMATRIRAQFDALQDNDRLRRELISNVSHDLRTPLATLHGYVDTLLLKGDSLAEDERRRYLEITRKHTKRLSELIDDLFELSKLDSGSMPLVMEDFSLSELLHDVVQEFLLEAKRREVDIEIVGGLQGAAVHADIGLVQRVLENLIRNALQHTPSGGRITLAITPRPTRVGVAVSDTGCGIPESEIDNIFERYFRAETSQSARGNSSGLGLAIVKGILDLHGSRIVVSSRRNEGTRFEFNLPAAAA